jgi:hypothetical protein
LVYVPKFMFTLIKLMIHLDIEFFFFQFETQTFSHEDIDFFTTLQKQFLSNGQFSLENDVYFHALDVNRLQLQSIITTKCFRLINIA